MPTEQFDWDVHNVEHLALHGITPNEAEQVVFNRPIDLGTNLREGEARTTQLGETNAGRILYFVATMRGERVRVVTSWPANERSRR